MSQKGFRGNGARPAKNAARTTTGPASRTAQKWSWPLLAGAVLGVALGTVGWSFFSGLLSPKGAAGQTVVSSTSFVATASSVASSHAASSSAASSKSSSSSKAASSAASSSASTSKSASSAAQSGYSTDNEDDIRAAAYTQLTPDQQTETADTWKKASVSTTTLRGGAGDILDFNYVGTEVYVVDVPKADGTTKYILFLAKDTGALVGYGFTD